MRATLEVVEDRSSIPDMGMILYLLLDKIGKPLWAQCFKLALSLLMQFGTLQREQNNEIYNTISSM